MAIPAKDWLAALGARAALDGDPCLVPGGERQHLLRAGDSRDAALLSGAQAPGLGAVVRVEGPPSPVPHSLSWDSSCSSALPRWERGCLPYAKHLRSQLTVAINRHGALSRGEHYHPAELQIPNLGREAPWLSAH